MAEAEWQRIRHGAQLARRLGLEVHAGHGLNFQTAETIVPLTGKALRKPLLGIGQNVNPKISGGAERFDHGNLVSEAHQQQRRVERDRGKRADGEPVRDAFRIENSGDRHAGGEPPAGAAEFVTCDPGHPNLSLT